MHPLVARIHPSFRTAFFAFVVARAALWLGLSASGRLTFTTPEVGTSLYRALSGLAPTPLLFAVVTELLLFAGLVAVYRFARRDGMPQTADRATWLWIASPAMAFALPGSDWTIAYALTALAIGAIPRARHSSAALCAAVLIRPEALIVWPALAWAWWAYRDEDASERLVLATMPVAMFAATVLGGIFVGEPGALLAAAPQWRTELQWHGVETHLEDLTIAAVLLGALSVSLRMLDDTPRGWFWLVAPVLVLVLLHERAFDGLAVLPFAVPLFVQLGKFAQEPGFERVLLSASLVGLLLLTLA